MDYERYEKGTVICEEGAVADRFYIIVSGHCDVLQVRKGAVGSEETQSIRVGSLNPLEVMGENALIVGDGRRHVRSATVTARSDIVQTLELVRSDFEQLVETGIIGHEVLQRMHAVQQERKDICKVLQQSHALQQTDLFQGINDDAVSNVIDAMEIRKFEPGTNLVTQGEEASELMIIMQGTATVFRDDAMVRCFAKLDIIGEIAVLPGEHVRGATVTADDEEVTALVLCKERYTRLKAEGVISEQIHERARRKSQEYRKLDLATDGHPPPPESL
jgi:CRP-like cAMP-binding protein